MNQTQDIDQEKWSQLVAQCWMDPQFQAHLVGDPQRVLHAAGIAVPAGVTLQVIADPPTRRTLVIPTAPPANDLLNVLEVRKAAGPKTQ